jgi:hypothetical protein
MKGRTSDDQFDAREKTMERLDLRKIACSLRLPLLFLAILAGDVMAQPVAQKVPANMFPVKAISHSTAPTGTGALTIARGRYFSYALPPKWHVGEDGQYALTLIAPDNQAFTLMVGNAGMFPNYPLDRFVWEKMMAIQPQNLQVSAPTQVAPAAGFQYAFRFDVTYTSQRGLPSRGLVKCSVAPAYDTELIVMTGAFSVETQWSGYSSWLPLTAEQISAIDGGAFGRRGIMAQNLRLSKEYGEATAAYREWSQRNWKQVTDQRDVSEDRRNHDVRESLGSTKVYTNPYDASAAVDLPLTYQYYWVNRQGTYVGTNDPSLNPNDGSTGEWKQMPQVNR